MSCKACRCSTGDRISGRKHEPIATYRVDDENARDDEGNDGEDDENDGEVDGALGRRMGALSWQRGVVYVRGYVQGANVKECWMSDTNRVNYRNGKRVNTFGRHVTR